MGEHTPLGTEEENVSLTLSPSPQKPQQPPPRPFRPAMAAKRRARSTSADRLLASKRGSSRPPSPGIISRMGKWAAQRSASPATQRMEVGEHKVITPMVSDIDGRMAALEQQRAVDHTYFQEIAAAMQVLGHSLTEEREKRLNLEAEVVKVEFQRRQEAAGAQERILSEIPARMAKFVEESLGPKLDEKFQAAQQAMEQVKVDVVRLAHHGDKVEKYLAGLEADRPREGQAIQHLVETEVGQVRTLIQQFEASGHVPTIGVSSIPSRRTCSRRSATWR